MNGLVQNAARPLMNARISGNTSKKGSNMKSKTLSNTNTSNARDNVPDIQFAGEENAWKLLSKAWSNKEGWMKSTKAMNVPGGVVIQVSTHQRSGAGDNAVAEALVFVPGVFVYGNKENGYTLQKS